MEAKKRSLALLLCVAAIGLTSAASAQENPELGDTGQAAGGAAWAPPSASASANANATASTETGVEASAETSEESSPGRAPSGSGSHADAVGALGVGFFGIANVPACLSPAQCGIGDAVSAPTIGVRYWISELLGIEAALGIGIESGTISRTGTADEFENSLTAFALHGGVPLALAYSGDFVFEVVPELDIAFASGTEFGDTQDQDVDLSGFMFRLGGRVGAEIHFGFIGLPQLSLQGTVGLHLSMTSQSFEDQMGREVSVSRTRLSTSTQEEPWDIFTGSVRAIYYFYM